MTPNAMVAAMALGLLVLSCVVGWQLVLTLRQARATALAIEHLITGARPRIEEAGDRLNALMSRADRILTAAEQSGAAGPILGAVARAVAGWKAGGRAISTISAVIAGIYQVWSSLAKGREAGGPAPAGGTSHE